MEELLIPLYENEVAPRFDQTTDVLLVRVTPSLGAKPVTEERVVVLARASAEEVCRLILNEHVKTVLCAGIEEEHYQFLTWKGVRVIDDVIGPVDQVLATYLAGELKPGAVLYAKD